MATQYFYERTSATHYTIKSTSTGCNSEIVDTASSLREAKAIVAGLNRKALLRHHVTGAIERGEATAIVEQRATTEQEG